MSMTLSEKIVYCRKKAGMSQEELADRVGVSRQAVSKWELADASPDIGKLLLLARTFGVTTDWLLSEEEPPEEDQSEREAPPPSHDNARPERAQERNASWVDSVPGVIGRLLRQYGWLFGVRLAVSGGLFTAMGFLMRAVFRSFGHTANSLMQESFSGGFSAVGTIWTDEAGNIISQTSGLSAPVSLITGFVIAVGVIMLIAGVVIAVSLRPKRKD